MSVAVRVDRLSKRYGPVIAVDDVALEVFEGEIFGIVGPNGAGKTTLIECIDGLRKPDSGEIHVLGIDVRNNSLDLRQRIGVQLQSSLLQPRIRVWEVMDLFAGFYRRSVDWRLLLQELGLEDKLKVSFGKLSGGQKQRLFIALALVNDPELVMLDELTTGLDPQARRATWDLIRNIRERGKTILLTTHFMEEAERLCDRVAIMDQGRIVALDSPAKLIAALETDLRIDFNVEGEFDADHLKGLEGVRRIEVTGDAMVVYGTGSSLVTDVVIALSSNGHRIRDLRTHNATLEDVFLDVTGKRIRD